MTDGHPFREFRAKWNTTTMATYIYIKIFKGVQKWFIKIYILRHQFVKEFESGKLKNVLYQYLSVIKFKYLGKLITKLIHKLTK
jgi:hypothetical protein